MVMEIILNKEYLKETKVLAFKKLDEKLTSSKRLKPAS